MALAVLAVSGCSALRFGYNQAPDLAYWWLDAYADFDEMQTLRTREGIARWFTWHRRTQLPEYARLLVRAEAEAPADTTPERVCGWWRELNERAEVALAEALPAAAGIITKLSAAQIRHIERRYAKTNDEFRSEYLAADPQQRLKDSVARAIDRIEFLYGRLDDAQRDQVARLIAASPFDPERWLAERMHRQQDALALLRRAAADKPGPDAALAMLRVYASRLFRSSREDYRRYQEKLEAFNCSLAASVHNGSSAAQRQALAGRLKGWELDLRVLAVDTN